MACAVVLKNKRLSIEVAENQIEIVVSIEVSGGQATVEIAEAHEIQGVEFNIKTAREGLLDQAIKTINGRGAELFLTQSYPLWRGPPVPS